MSINQRKHIRFHLEEDSYMSVTIDDLKPLLGLCISESHGGCSGVFYPNERFKAGAIVIVKVGRLEPEEAEIRYFHELADDVVKMGFEFRRAKVSK